MFSVEARRTDNGLVLTVSGEVSNISKTLQAPVVQDGAIRIPLTSPVDKSGMPGAAGCAMTPVNKTFSVVGAFGSRVRVKIDGEFDEDVPIG